MEDTLKVTNKIFKAAQIFDIELLDHIVIGDGCYKSIFVEMQKRCEENGVK